MKFDINFDPEWLQACIIDEARSVELHSSRHWAIPSGRFSVITTL